MNLTVEDENTKQTADRIISSFMAVLSIICFTESYRLWNGWDGPGTLPLMVGCIFLFLTAGFLVFPSEDKTGNLLPGKKMVRHIGITIGSFALYLVFIKWLGYPLATWFLLGTVVISMTHGFSWTTIIWTGLVSLTTYIILKFYLTMPLPPGFIGI